MAKTLYSLLWIFIIFSTNLNSKTWDYRDNPILKVSETINTHLYSLPQSAEISKFMTSNFNWPIKGYYHWTLVDNFEWERGWSQRFGLWELDFKTQERRKRKSASLYEKICKENALTSEIVSAFVPELLDTIFPG